MILSHSDRHEIRFPNRNRHAWLGRMAPSRLAHERHQPASAKVTTTALLSVTLVTLGRCRMALVKSGPAN